MSPTKVQTLREKTTLDVSPDGVMWVDSSGNIILVNAAMERMSGYTQAELVGSSVGIFLPERIRKTHEDHVKEYFLRPRLRAMGGLDMTLTRRNGDEFPVDIALGLWDEDQDRYAVAFIRDMTERKRFEENLRFQATHDSLTRLPNRRFFTSALDKALAESLRGKGVVGVIIVDLDDFKGVNDSLGHPEGDELLVQVGQRLRETLRAGDILARIGGDEFAILISRAASEEEVLVVVRKILSAFDASFQLYSSQIHVGASVGVSLCPRDSRDGAHLMRFADMAMYQAKQSGKSNFACYSWEMDQRAQRDLAIQIRLKRALQEGRLRLHYQPQLEMQTRRIIGAEALLRWTDDELGEVSPAVFVPIAERTGLIQQLSDWVLEEACRQIAYWDAVGTPLRVAVNFSAHQFRREDLAAEVYAAMERFGTRPDLLEIEITETAAMATPEFTRGQIRALAGLGCSITLDDFGTGFSSLSYLKDMPFGRLKIDREFVGGMPDNQDDVRITRSVIALAHSFGMSVVAEGVEDTAQEQLLQEMRCEYWQGWLCSKAVSAEDLALRFLIHR